MNDDVLTYDKIRRAMRLLDEGSVTVPRYQVVPTAGGHWASVRQHAKSRNGGKLSYHLRVQKKWDRRFGRSWVETQKRGEAFIIGGTTVLVRREDYPEVLRALS